jgi:hypothetical protein
MKPSIAIVRRDRASGKNRRGRGKALWKKKQDLPAGYLQRSKPLLVLFVRSGSDVGSQAKDTLIEVARPVEVGNVKGNFQ